MAEQFPETGHVHAWEDPCTLACSAYRTGRPAVADLIYTEIAMFAHSRGSWKPRELADHLATYLAPYMVYPPGAQSEDPS